jgi:hypothetical protein
VDINYRFHPVKRHWIAEVWQDNVALENIDGRFVYGEDKYDEMNEWCKQNFKYHARTAYHVFEFKERSQLDWFILRWR